MIVIGFGSLEKILNNTSLSPQDQYPPIIIICPFSMAPQDLRKVGADTFLIVPYRNMNFKKLVRNHRYLANQIKQAEPYSHDNHYLALKLKEVVTRT